MERIARGGKPPKGKGPSVRVAKEFVAADEALPPIFKSKVIAQADQKKK